MGCSGPHCVKAAAPRLAVSLRRGHAGGISYTQYRNIFPMWALARYAQRYPDRAAAGSGAAAARPKGSPKRAARSPKRAK